MLARAFVQDLQREGRPTRLTSNAFRRLLRGAWPFNVRQLRQTLGTAALLASGDGTITADALAEVLEHDDGLPENPDEVRTLRDELLRSLARCSGDPERIAKEMNRSTVQIQRWLERFAISSESFK
jgi:transcriptional regulator of acetoin/glycerol metabolism